MLFQSLQFLLFLLPVFLLNLYVTNKLKSLRARKLLLIAGSAFFYMSWSGPLFGLLTGSILLNFLAGGRIAGTEEQAQKKNWVRFGVIAQLLILGLFKYLNFGIESAEILLAGLGFEVPRLALDIVLPLGISFYTFQGMSYVIDVYRGSYPPYESFLDFFLYISFFPQLVAGPIVRADYFLARLREIEKPITLSMVNSGLFIFVSGVFKKAVLADNAAKIANFVFQDPGDLSGMMTLLGLYAFAFQIYFDFSGYTDMARGIGRMLGIDLPINFNAPYLAKGLRDFWQRWHISLSTWLRDYLYISLGGSRVSSNKTYRNLLITMILGGLWHGASFNFIVWGAIHGGALAIEHATLGKGKRETSSWLGSFLAILLTFHLVCLAWIFFRATESAIAFTILGNIFDPVGWVNMQEVGFFKPQNWLFGLIAPAFYVFVLDRPLSTNDIGLDMPRPFLRAVAFCLFFFLTLLTAGQTSEFIYFQF